MVHEICFIIHESVLVSFPLSLLITLLILHFSTPPPIPQTVLVSFSSASREQRERGEGFWVLIIILSPCSLWSRMYVQ